MAGSGTGVLAAHGGVSGDGGRLQGGVADVEQGFGVSDFVVDGALQASIVCGLLPGATTNGNPEEHTDVVRVVGQVGSDNPFGKSAVVDVLELVLQGVAVVGRAIEIDALVVERDVQVCGGGDDDVAHGREAGHGAADHDVFGEAGDVDVGAVWELGVVESGQGDSDDVGDHGVGECAGVLDPLPKAAAEGEARWARPSSVTMLVTAWPAASVAELARCGACLLTDAFMAEWSMLLWCLWASSLRQIMWKLSGAERRTSCSRITAASMPLLWPDS